MEKMAVQIRESDHVATAVMELLPGETVIVSGIRNGHVVLVNERIPAGHKIALRAIAADQEILKYGEPIGVATDDISAGHWVHVHNCRGVKARRLGRPLKGRAR